jgi:hypothetical protein
VYNTADLKARPVVLDEVGCAKGCSGVDPGSQDLVVGRPDAMYFYSHEEGNKGAKVSHPYPPNDDYRGYYTLKRLSYAPPKTTNGKYKYMNIYVDSHRSRRSAFAMVTSCDPPKSSTHSMS